MEKHLQVQTPVSSALKPVRIQTSAMCSNFSLYGTQSPSLPHSATVLCPSFLKQLVPLSLDFRLLGCPTISALMGSRKVDFINCFFLLLVVKQGITFSPQFSVSSSEVEFMINRILTWPSHLNTSVTSLLLPRS